MRRKTFASVLAQTFPNLLTWLPLLAAVTEDSESSQLWAMHAAKLFCGIFLVPSLTHKPSPQTLPYSQTLGSPTLWLTLGLTPPQVRFHLLKWWVVPAGALTSRFAQVIQVAALISFALNSGQLPDKTLFVSTCRPAGLNAVTVTRQPGSFTKLWSCVLLCREPSFGMKQRWKGCVCKMRFVSSILQLNSRQH